MTPVWRAASVIAGVHLCVGAWGVALAASDGFTEATGALLGSADLEVRLMTYNTLGALVTVLIGAVGLAGALLGRRLLLWAAAAGAAITVVQVLVQWGQAPSNVFGAVGANLSFGLFGAVGFATLAGAAGLAAPGVEPTATPRPRGVEHARTR